MTLIVGIIGTGAMGAGIAQVALTSGCKVLLYDNSETTLQKGYESILDGLEKLLSKQKITSLDKTNFTSNLSAHQHMNDFKDCDLVIEAVVEYIEVKQQIFSSLEKIVGTHCILASNTSSLSIAAIGSSCVNSERVIGVHFFNPAVIMPLVEIIPSLTTSETVLKTTFDIIKSWGKHTVIAKDTPGFIVNRLARPYYGEAIKMYEEGIADFATIDFAMRTLGGFKMGPFELMDFIGNDINFKVTETVWQQFFYDARYRPSLTQKRLFESKLFGKKTGKGYYTYGENASVFEPNKDPKLLQTIFNRIIAMLINEAAEALYLSIASKEDLDNAMMKGVHYKQGLLKWGDEIGIENVLHELNNLYEWYADDRYRPSVLLKQMAKDKTSFY